MDQASQTFLAIFRNILVQWLIFAETVASLWQSLPMLQPQRFFSSQGQYILEAMRVMSISRRIFSKGGSFTLKEELPLNVTTFLLLAFSWPFSRSSDSSILTLTGSKVRTLDWKIRKSEAYTLETREGLYSLTQIWFFSDEYSMKYSMSLRGRLLSTGFLQRVANARLFSASMQARTSSKANLVRQRMVQLNLTLQDCSFSFLDWISKQLGSLMSLKNWLILYYISLSLPRRTSCYDFPRFSLLYSMTRLSSFTLAILNCENRDSSHLMQSKIEQLLMRQNEEQSQKMLACSSAKKKMGSWDLKQSLLARRLNWLKKVSMANSCSCSKAWRSLSSFLCCRYSPNLSWMQLSKEIRLLLLYPFYNSPYWSSYQTITEKRFSEFLNVISSTRRLLGVMVGTTWTVLQAQ